MKKLILFFAIIYPNLSFAEENKFFVGLWQSSYAYLGKQPFFNNYVIFNKKKLVVEKEGVLKESYELNPKIIQSDYAILEIINAELENRYIRVDRNLKFGCKPKSKLKYDRECNSLIWDNAFSFCIYKYEEKAINKEGKCTRKEKYYTFTSKQIEKISNLSESI